MPWVFKEEENIIGSKIKLLADLSSDLWYVTTDSKGYSPLSPGFQSTKFQEVSGGEEVVMKWRKGRAEGCTSHDKRNQGCQSHLNREDVKKRIFEDFVL